MKSDKRQKKLPLEDIREKYLRLLSEGKSREQVWTQLTEEEKVNHPFAVYCETSKRWMSIREAILGMNSQTTSKSNGKPLTAAERLDRRLAMLVVQCWETHGKEILPAVSGYYVGMQAEFLGAEVPLEELDLHHVRLAGEEWRRRYPPNPPPKFLVLSAKEKSTDGTTTPPDTKDAPKPGASHREKIYGHPVTAVVRWMGREGMSVELAKKVLAKVGNSHLSDTTIRIQLKAGEKGERGAPAQLTEKQEKEIWDFAE